jgi:hypothetical protein
MNAQQPISNHNATPIPRLQFLTADQVIQIDKILAAVGQYGEVHLVVQKGELRYINKVESYKAWDDPSKQLK